MRLWEQSVELESFVMGSRSYCHIRLGFARHYNDGTRPKNVTVNQSEWLAERFEAHRTHLRAVAYRMLGSLSEADDAVQEAWLHVLDGGLLPDGNERIAKEWERISLRKVKCCISHTV